MLTKNDMSTSVSVVCYKYKVLSNGESPLMLQICKNGQRKFKSIGVSIHQNNWDFLKQKPKPTCPNGELILKIILDKFTEVQKQILTFSANQKEFTLTKLLDAGKTSPKEKTVGEFYAHLIQQYKNENKVGNRLVYKTSFNSIKEFSNGKLNLMFADIDLVWLNKYEKWLRAKGNKETTMSVLFRTLRSAYNKAIEANCASRATYPFDQFRVGKFDVKTQKRAISKLDMLMIMNADLSAESESLNLTRDVFIFSYLCGGINFTDIANLKADNIINGRLEYVRQKTGKKLSFKLSEQALLIVSLYTKDVFKRGYLFPMLDKSRHITALQKQNRIHKLLVRTNKELKSIAVICGLDFNISSYCSRHSFATILKNSGVNVSLISEALGHQNIAVTAIYLDSFDNQQVDEALTCLI